MAYDCTSCTGDLNACCIATCIALACMAAISRSEVPLADRIWNKLRFDATSAPDHSCAGPGSVALHHQAAFAAATQACSDEVRSRCEVQVQVALKRAMLAALCCSSFVHNHIL